MRTGMLFCMAMLFFLGTFTATEAVSIVTYGSPNTINAMAVHDDWLWCATEGGVVRWNTKDFTHTVFTVAEGLANNSVKGIAVGDDGTVWAGTMGGACRYDGVSWKTFTKADGLLSNAVGPVAVDHQGVVWMAAFEAYGLSRYENGVWTSFPNIFVGAIAVGLDNTAWFACYGDGIKSFHAGEWTQHIVQQFYYLRNVTVGLDGVVWVVSDMAIHWYSDGKWNIASNGDLQTGINTPQAGAKNGMCWASSGPELGVLRIDSKTRTAIKVPFPDDYPLVLLCTITVGQDDVAWFGSKAGVFRYDGARWTVLRVREGLASNYISALSSGPDGTLWVGTTFGGVSSFDGTQWRSYTREDGLWGEYVEYIAVGPGKEVWVATKAKSADPLCNGLSRFDGTKWETVDPSSVLPKRKINSLAVDLEGALLVATEREINRFDGSQWTVISSPSSSYIYSMKVDPSGVVWICAESHGVFKRVNGEWISVPLDQNPLDERLRRISFGKKSVYSSAHFVYKYADNQWKMVGGEDTFGSLAVGPYDEPWIGDSDGVSIYNGFSWNKHRICKTVGDITSDGKDGMWLGTWFEGVKHMIAPPGIHGRVSLQDTGQGIPGAVVIVTPKDYVLYTDERGEFRIPDISSGTYTLRARVKANDNSGYLEVVQEGVIVSSDEETEVNLAFHGAVAGVADQPDAFRVDEPFPNPFNPSTSLGFTLPAAERVTLAIYDITGRKVRDIISGPLPAGTHTAVWDGRDADGRAVSSGVYTARLTAGRETVSRKMTLLR